MLTNPSILRRLVIRLDVSGAAALVAHLWCSCSRLLKALMKPLRFAATVILMLTWIFSGWPGPGSRLAFPAKVQEALAAPEIVYKSSTVPYNPYTLTGAATNAFDPSTSYDNALSSQITLPFTFNFYGTNYTSVWISTNGFVSFTGDSAGDSTGAQIIPNTDQPNGLIAAAWADLYASSSNASQIRYETFGSAPDRVFVVDFLNLAQCCEEASPRMTSQVWLRETSNVIELHTDVVVLTSPDSSYSQGVENAAGTGATATKNGTDNFNVDNEGLRFRPTALYEERYLTGSVVYTSSTTWTAPAGVTAVNVEAWGGGGAGGGNNDSANDGGGGGGGGAYAKKSNISVTPGNDYSVVVGAGGTAVNSSAGGAGGDSYFNSAATVMAKGGGGGGANSGSGGSGTGGTAGSGGAAGSSVGDTTYSGGAGGAGFNSTTGRGGGGGGSAGTTSAGTAGTAGSSANTGATAVVGGGPGGYGTNTSGTTDGSAPDIGPGGGGGGAAEGATVKGGDGYAGRVRITYIYSWTAPTGVTSVDVEVWGGGGGGGGQQRIQTDGGGGGGGGGYSKKTSIAVTPGNSYSVVAGGAGLGGTCLTGLSGDDSYFKDTSTVLAKGGAGGPNSTGTPGSGGAGGASGSGVGDTKYSGGNGGKGRDNTDGRGGPGGTSAGTAVNGTSGATTWAITTAARPPLGGGMGGAGGNADGVNGFVIPNDVGNGGGGGGAAESISTSTCTIGGAGHDGKVIITYDPSGATSETYSTGSVVYTSSTTWTAPAGVTAVNVEVWGGGGAGGGNNDATADGGGGGGGGAYAKKSNISVTPGNDYSVVVGAGGTAVNSSAGGAGGDSYFDSAATVMAKGGGGGGANSGTAGSGTGGVAGTGGASGSSVGDTKYSGGNGEEGLNNTNGRGGGGGGSGGISSVGTVGTNNSNTGATAVVGGGPGGYGTASAGTTNGLAPNIGPGGGGGGAAEGAAVKGGDGYAGRVRITYIYSWTAPAGVTSVDVEAWGGGGGGAGQQRITSDGGGGGGGGAYSRDATVSVTPGNTYSVVAGAGGLGGTCISGLDGGDSYFVDTSTVLAKGGGGGANSTGTPPAGPSGGASGSGVGDPGYAASGGAGGTGRDNTSGLGGPGGSSAGTAGIGTSGPSTWSTQTASAAPDGGGIGGNGAGTIGTNGSAPASGSGGGGGGAAESPSATTCSIGGAGADGKIVLTYIAVANSAPTLSVAQPDGSGDTVTVGDSYNVTYTLADSDNTVTAAFYYDTNASGLDGVAITGACASAAEGTGATCAWDTTGMTPGSYYVYGVADDGTNSPVSAYSSGQITINPSTVISVTVGDGSVAYGQMGTASSRSTSTGMWDTQSATNTGNVAEDFNIRGSNSAAWTLSGTAGSEQYVHAFCTASCTSAPTNYSALTTSDALLASNVAVNGAQRFDLNLSTPTGTANYTQQNVDVTVTAVQH